MKATSLLKSGLIASMVLLASCSKNGGADFMGTSANGLGQFTRFAGQRPGESYTTQAPHSQLYLFSYDSSQLAPRYLESLHAQSEYLRSHPGAKVLLAGHTDEKGSREYNVALGERRAHAVASHMYRDGVPHNQVRIVSYGKERPANYGHDADSHAQNRRVEFTYESTR